MFALSMPAVPASADQYRDMQWYLKSLRIAEAHRMTEGAGVIVAVIDTGVSAAHSDLDGAVLPGKNVLGSGGDGRQDAYGHGTSMAGIIAARGRGGGRGLLGVAPRAKILPVRPSGDTLVTVDAIRWSVAHGAKVINMSFAMDGSDQLADAVKLAADKDVVLVGAAGNSGTGANSQEYPAAYPEVVAVGAVDRTGDVPSFSQRGPQIDLVAPGVDIPTLPRDAEASYKISRGTSEAAAIVSGAAALIRARFPELSAAEVVQRLTSTAVDKGAPGRDDTYGHGSLNLMAALTAKAPPPSSVPSAPATGPTVVSAPDGDDDGSGVPLLVIGLGVLLLAGAAVAAVLVVRRSGA
ncbi:MAG TPA: S8 family serine peptidase [Actinoplanes sp.]|jgi:type VII secretion-associated serine protease mycosin